MTPASIHNAEPAVNPTPDPTAAAAFVLPDRATIVAGALDALARGFTLLPVDPADKAPKVTAQAYLDGRRNLTAADVRRYAARGAVFGVALGPSGLVVLDLDTPDPAAAGELAPCFAGPHVTPTRSGGRHAWFARPDGMAARRTVKPGGRPLDVLGAGYAIAWGGRVPTPAELPPDVLAEVAALTSAPPDPPTAPSGPVAVPDASRGAAYVYAAAAAARADVAALLEGTRQVGLNAAAFRLGQALSRADRPDLAAYAADALATAAPWAGTRKERSTIRRALAAGMVAAVPGLPDRPIPSGSSSGPAPAPGPDADAIRAAAATRIDRLAADVKAVKIDGRPLHPKRQTTLRLFAAHVLNGMIESGRPDHAEGLALIGLAIDRGRSACRAAAELMPELGFDVTTGGLDADGAARATVYAANFAHNRPLCRGPRGGGSGRAHVTAYGRSVVREIPALDPRAELEAAGSDVCRGLRRRPKGAARGGVPTSGDNTGAAVAIMRERGGTVTAGELAPAVGCSEATARRILGAMHARGAAVETEARRAGRGRPRRAYTLAEHVTATLAATVELGARARANMQAALDAGRERLRRARALALRGVAPVKVLLARLVDRTRAERETARPGGERGRPGWDRDDASRALAASATWVLDGLRHVGAIDDGPPADLTPPTWAVEAVPLW